MDVTIISQRYAKALFELAQEMNILEEVTKDMELVGTVTAENPEFKRILASPVIPQGKKAQIIKGIFSGKVQKLTFRFLQLVVKKERELYLLEISNHFISIYKKYKNIMVVELTTAYSIDEQLRKELLQLLKDHTHQNIELHEKVDKNIIGGFILNLEDSRYDASLRNKINRLKKTFEINLYEKKF